jgi:hypothetical protein
MTERDELARIVQSVNGPSGNDPDVYDWETADAILAAGYRKVHS